jgi:hypothetical protein
MELAATGDSHRELRLHVVGVNAMREAIFTSRHTPGEDVRDIYRWIATHADALNSRGVAIGR